MMQFGDFLSCFLLFQLHKTSQLFFFPFRGSNMKACLEVRCLGKLLFFFKLVVDLDEFYNAPRRSHSQKQKQEIAN